MNEEKKKLFDEWLKSKKAEDRAKEKRYAVEQELEKLYILDPSNISQTFKEEDIGFRINLKKNFTYNLDQDAYSSIRTEIPENLRPEKIKFSLDLKGYEYLKDCHIDLYKKISDCVSYKDNKTTIKVEKI